MLMKLIEIDGETIMKTKKLSYILIILSAPLFLTSCAVFSSMPGSVGSEESKGRMVTIPDVTGKTVSEAHNELDEVSKSLKISEKDATEENRQMWDKGNWIVCSQSIVPNSEVGEYSKIVLKFAESRSECSNKIIGDDEGNYSGDGKIKGDNVSGDDSEIIDPNDIISTGLTKKTALKKCDSTFNDKAGLAGDFSFDYADIRESKKVTNNNIEEWQFKVGYKGKVIREKDDFSWRTAGYITCNITGSEENPNITSLLMKDDEFEPLIQLLP